MVTSSGTSYVNVPSRNTRDIHGLSFREVKKEQIDCLGDNAVFRNVKKYHKVRGEMSDIEYTDWIEETHKIKRLSVKDEIVRSGFMAMGDLQITAPYDSQIQDHSQYRYMGEYYSIIELEPHDTFGMNGYIKAFGRKLSQQQNQSESDE